MSAARQLCRASNTVAPSDRPLSACPHCSTKVTPTSYSWIQRVGGREKRPVIPAHPRDEHGEMRTEAERERNRRPWASS